MQKITPKAAFDVVNGQASALHEDWPGAKPSEGYRWLHFDVSEPTFSAWTQQHLPRVASASLLQQETRPRLEALRDGFILNLRGVNLNPNSDPEDMVTVRLWVTEASVISAQVRRVFAIEAMQDAMLSSVPPATVGQFVSDLAFKLVTRIETVSLELEERTDALEEQVSDGTMINQEELTNLRQSVIKLRRFVNPQRDAIASLAEQRGLFLDEERDLVRETSNRTRRTVEELDATRERLIALQDRLDAVGAEVIGRNGYILSIVAAIFLPLGFFTGLFGVNVAGMPGVETPWAFAALTGVSLLSGIALYALFKFAKWL
ncbi:MAG: zinc transporter ZntB [Pseudomonadota bacterium]